MDSNIVTICESGIAYRRIGGSDGSNGGASRLRNVVLTPHMKADDTIEYWVLSYEGELGDLNRMARTDVVLLAEPDEQSVELPGHIVHSFYNVKKVNGEVRVFGDGHFAYVQRFLDPTPIFESCDSFHAGSLVG